jgi:two-component system NtrC family sensor kinase
MSQTSGVHEIEKAGDQVLVAYNWLKETNWALLVWQPLVIAHAQMYNTRKIMMVSLIVLLCITSVIIYALTRQIVNHAQASTEKSQDLQSQLVHASKLASIGELATGVAHEINNPLAIITSTSGVIQDMLDPEFELNASPENILKEVKIIESAAFRASKITRQLLDFGHEYQPSLSMCDVHAILDEVINGLKAREFKVEDIEIRRQYEPNLPKVLLDSDQIRQVFLNIINNAGDAISGPGVITISTTKKDGEILVTIKDTGKGMTSEQMGKIFDPFYTTKEVGKGTGLGLSVSLSIVESMGGSITAQSLPGEGSSFAVSLPLRKEIKQA